MSVILGYFVNSMVAFCHERTITLFSSILEEVHKFSDYCLLQMLRLLSMLLSASQDRLSSFLLGKHDVEWAFPQPEGNVDGQAAHDHQ